MLTMMNKREGTSLFGHIRIQVDTETYEIDESFVHNQTTRLGEILNMEMQFHNFKQERKKHIRKCNAKSTLIGET